MNHELHIILMHLKTFTYLNTKMCNFIHIRDKCAGVACKHCILNRGSPTSDQYASRLIFRVPI
jgi:hypothetical protein|nr:MAG TPA: hypothetical protein [Caudoviricetes sp.]